MARHDRRRSPSTERRSQRRVSGAELPTLSAQLSGGARVSLLDLSQGGVRLETTRHMRPGQRVSVRFSVDSRVVTVTARVVRAAVVHVHPEEVRYETGLRLAEDLACDLLDVALVERRAANPEAPEDASATGLVFTAVTAEGLPGDTSEQGWWLASRQRLSRGHDHLLNG